MLTLAVILVGAWASERAEQAFGVHDDNRIVIDEVAGQLVTLLFLVPFVSFYRASGDHGASGAYGISGDLVSLFPWVVTGFVLFRVFDVVKPGAVAWAERGLSGGWGVMADDVVAGIYAGVCLVSLHELFGVVPNMLGSSSWQGPLFSSWQGPLS